MTYSLAFHVVGLVMWLGGLLIISRMMKAVCLGGGEAVGKIAKRVFFGYAIGGLVVATLTGAYQLSVKGMSFYMTQGWFHTKLTLVLVLFAMTAMLGSEIKKANSGGEVKAGRLGMIHGITATSLLVISLLTLIGRG